MNPRTRKAALYAIGVIAILASANALAHSYAGEQDAQRGMPRDRDIQRCQHPRPGPVG
jgi:hypothetical protein